MIYPDVKLEDWLKKYPELSPLDRTCEGCGKTMSANIPFVMKGYVGVTSGDCQCGKNKGKCSSRITTSDVEFNRWSKLISTYM